jgi:hypothetical protein
MKSIAGFNFFNELISLTIGFLFGLFLQTIGKHINRWKVRYKLNKYQICFKNVGLYSLDHADPFYKPENLRLKNTEDSFYLSFPRDTFQEILNICDSFSDEAEPRQEIFFGDNADIMVEKLANMLGMELIEVRRLLREHKDKIAFDMYERLKKGQTLFNGKMFGVKKIISSRTGSAEDSVLILNLFTTDYFTHRVMASIYQELRKEKHPISQVIDIQEVNKYYAFATSFGMDTILYLEDEKPSHQIVLTKRSKYLYNMNKDQWHLSMNEALTLTDIDYNNNISLKQCVERGLREELHLDLKDKDDVAEYYYGDLAFFQDLFELGITNLTKIKGYSYENVRQNYQVAKDCNVESADISNVSSHQSQIKRFFNKNDVTPACRFCLYMWNARNFLQ